MAEFRYEEHTDSVAEKLQLLARFYAAGDRDVALSLASSIRDTLQFERHRAGDADSPQVGAAVGAPVRDLPGPAAEECAALEWTPPGEEPAPS